MEAIQIISQDVFDKIRSRFSKLQLGDKTGAVTIDPAEARFFDFDFVIEGVNLGRVSISLNDLGSLKIYYSQGITEDQDDFIRKKWFYFLKEMRFFAMRRLLRFDTRDIAKTNLDKNDFQHLAKTQGPKDMNMRTTNELQESRWNQRSSRKTSRAVTGQTEVIIRHAKPVEETYPGARSQKGNIKAIFVQSKEGERWKSPFNYPSLGFAIAQHVDHGGVPHDPAGKAIINMAEEIIQLQDFQKKIQRSSLHHDAVGITEKAVGRLHELKSKLAALGKRRHYQKWITEFNEIEHPDEKIVELDSVTMEDYKSKFTQKTFEEDLVQYFPLLHRIMRESNKINLETYILEKDDHEDGDFEPARPDENGNFPEDEFGNWADTVEQNKLTDDQVAELKKQLAELPSESGEPKLELGPNGQTAWQFFNNLGINDSELEDDLEKMSDINAEENALEVFVLWADKTYPELLVKLGISDKPTQEMTQPEGRGTNTVHGIMPSESSQTENDEGTMGKGMMAKEGKHSKSMVEEVAKIIKSFYNKDNPEVGPFRSEEGIIIDVEKTIKEKFGEKQAEHASQLAKQFIQKLTKEWVSKHNSNTDDGLARIQELSGLKKI